MLALLTIVRDGEALAQLAGVTKVLNDLSCVAFADLSSTDNAFVTIVQRRLTADWPGLFNTRRGHILDLAASATKVLLERRRRVGRTYEQALSSVIWDERRTVLSHLELPCDLEPCYSYPIDIRPL